MRYFVFLWLGLGVDSRAIYIVQLYASGLSAALRHFLIIEIVDNLKIIYLHQYFNTLEMAGGTRSFEMARRLVAAGHDVQMITSWRNDDRRAPNWPPLAG